MSDRQTEASLDRPFASFFQGGFECSTQRRDDGRRLDLAASTGHDQHALRDYEGMLRHGLRTVRDGLRWHLIEPVPGTYDWSSFLPMLRAAREAGVQVVWDLCHYGVPDHIDIWSPSFVDAFGRFCAAAARVVEDETDDPPIWCPVNEISFWAWAAGDQGLFEPVARGRAAELKLQLARAALTGIDALRTVDPRARILTAEPLIQVLPRSERAADRRAAHGYHEAQYEARDMLAGLRAPELGGSPGMVDLVGVNYYPNNQWVLEGPCVEFGNARYRPLFELLLETWKRYRLPLTISETGAEGSARAAWLFYVSSQVRLAMDAGVPIHGVCLYPILDYPGWKNDRPCQVGLFGAADPKGLRMLDAPLADELRRQQGLFSEPPSRRLGPPFEEAREHA